MRSNKAIIILFAIASCKHSQLRKDMDQYKTPTKIEGRHLVVSQDELVTMQKLASLTKRFEYSIASLNSKGVLDFIPKIPVGSEKVELPNEFLVSTNNANEIYQLYPGKDYVKIYTVKEKDGKKISFSLLKNFSNKEYVAYIKDIDQKEEYVPSDKVQSFIKMGSLNLANVGIDFLEQVIPNSIWVKIGDKQYVADLAPIIIATFAKELNLTKRQADHIDKRYAAANQATLKYVNKFINYLKYYLNKKIDLQIEGEEFNEEIRRFISAIDSQVKEFDDISSSKLLSEIKKRF